MKKMINYRLTEIEKQLLKNKKITQKLLQDYAPDEIAEFLHSSPQRTKELRAMYQILWLRFGPALISASAVA
jgi:hypothetical protein